MWTPATRRQHSRAGLRYASDLTDDEWRILEPLLPAAPGRGRRRAWPLREIANAIFYVLRAGCTWRLLPDSFPPWRTVYRWFVRLRDGGVFEAINHHLVMLDRERVGREAQLDGGGDRQPERQDHRERRAARLRRGQEGQGPQAPRHGGRGLTLDNHPASIQDRDGAPPLMRGSRCRWPFVQLAFMDSGYAGDRVASATTIRVEIVRKPKDQVGFAVHARRWVVERFFAWIGRNRRLAKDFEATIASVIILLRRVARSA